MFGSGKTIAFFFIFLSSLIHGQGIDTITALPEVTVTAFQERPIKESSLNISTLHLGDPAFSATFNLSESLSKIPGVSALTTGLGISKPVVRGLFGNRVLILLSGLKFDNQQWQEEHGLGIADMGIARIELIKGPYSIIYGTEAMGGVVNIIEEGRPQANTSVSDVGIKFNSNTLGGSLQIGYKKSSGNKWSRLRIGIENHADYTDGDNKRILNSRMDGYSLKTTLGFIKNKWTSETNFMSSFNRSGFIFEDVYSFIETDARYSRKLGDNPAHYVLLNILSSENKFQYNENSKLTINGGIQSNERLENEGSGAISLNMHLLTVHYLAKYERILSNRNKVVLSHYNNFQDNTNFGARKIVPDARLQEANFSFYYESEKNQKWIFENGISIGEKWIKTYFTPSVNGPEKEIHPFNKFSPYFNLFSGISANFSSELNVKANVSTGVRVPNLAELSSNGLHEGIFNYEVGDPNLKNEVITGFNVVFDYNKNNFYFNLSPFFNHFENYVFLAPTDEEWFGFPVYRFKQQPANQYGTELQTGIKPIKNLEIGVAFSVMNSVTKNGNNTPFIPAPKLVPSIKYTAFEGSKTPIYCTLEFAKYFAQNNVYPGEKTTPNYTLVNVGLSSKIVNKDRIIIFGIKGDNLMNVTYYDHLSRFKNLGLNNIGRNFGIFLKSTFTK